MIDLFPQIIKTHNAHEFLGAYPSPPLEIALQGAPACRSSLEDILEQHGGSALDDLVIQQVDGVTRIGLSGARVDESGETCDAFLRGLEQRKPVPQRLKGGMRQVDASLGDG